MARKGGEIRMELECTTCGRQLHAMDFIEVPRCQIAWYACYGDFEGIRTGWYFCPECNDWIHKPSVMMAEDMARQQLAK